MAEHVRYIERTRDYYLEQGYETPYRWAHFEDAPFSPPSKPLSESRLALISTSEIAPNAFGVYNAYSQRKTREADAPDVLRRCREDKVDVALLTPV